MKWRSGYITGFVLAPWVFFLAIQTWAALLPEDVQRQVEIAKHLSAADSLVAEGHLHEAREHLEAALQIDSNRVDVRRRLAQIYGWMDRPQEAIAQYEAILRLDPQDTSAMRNLADFYFWTNQEKKGLRVLEQLLQFKPDDRHLRWKAAQHATWAGEYAKAAEHLKILLKSSPRDTAIVRALKENLLWAGDTKVGLAVYRYYLSLVPERNDLWLDYARQCAWNGQPAEAIRAYQLLKRRQALTDSTFHEYIEVLIWQAKEREAIQELRVWVEFHPNDRWSLWKLAQLLEWNDRSTSEVRQVLTQLLSIEPTHSSALEMYRRVNGFPKRQWVTGWQYVTDSNDLTTQLAQSRFVFPLTNAVQLRAATWHRNLTEVRPDTAASMWGEGAYAGVVAHLGLRWTLTGILQLTRYHDGWQAHGNEVSLHCLALPTFSLRTTYRSGESLAGAFGLRSHLRETLWRLDWQFEPLPSLLFYGWMARTDISDGNTKVETFLSGLWYLPVRAPRLALSGYIGAEDFERIYPESIPYWTPDRLQHRSLGVEMDHLVHRRLGVSAGMAVAQNPGYPVSLNLRGSLILHFSPSVRLLLEYFDFGSRAYHSSTVTCRFTADL